MLLSLLCLLCCPICDEVVRRGENDILSYFRRLFLPVYILHTQSLNLLAAELVVSVLSSHPNRPSGAFVRGWIAPLGFKLQASPFAYVGALPVPSCCYTAAFREGASSSESMCM